MLNQGFRAFRASGKALIYQQIYPYLCGVMDQSLDEKWDEVEQILTERFGKTPDMEATLFLIGIQELGQLNRKFSKEQKQDLMHIAVCTLLSKSGYYRRDGTDQDGWPHFTELKKVTGLTAEEQEKMLKRHIITYFENNGTLKTADVPASHH